MQATFHVEIVEARNLPNATRGGRPDPVVAITCIKRPQACVRTQLLAANNNPVYNQNFCFEGCDEVEDFELAVYDRELSTRSILARTTFQMGGSGKTVGSRYFLLTKVNTIVEIDGSIRTTLDPAPVPGTPNAPAVHLVWRTELKPAQPKTPTEDQRFSVAALKGGHEPAQRVDVSPSKGEAPAVIQGAAQVSSPHGSPSKQDDDAAAAAALRNTAISQEVLESLVTLTRTVRKLEGNMNLFQDSVERKLSTVDARILEIETVLSIRNSNRASTAESLLKQESEKVAQKRDLRASSDQSNMDSRLSADARENAKKAEADVAVVNITGEVNAVGALSSIELHPTKVSAHDQQLLANYTYHQVAVPQVPHSDRPPHKEKLDDNLERRIAASTLGMEAQVREITSTVQ